MIADRYPFDDANDPPTTLCVACIRDIAKQLIICLLLCFDGLQVAFDDDDASDKWTVLNVNNNIKNRILIRYSPNIWDEYAADSAYIE